MARDGEHRECPIVPANIVRLRYGEDEDDVLVVSPTHDTIQMFPNPDYTYLRYFNPEQGELVAVWLGQEVLADLVDEGIPLCIRDCITEQEVELYERHLGKIAANFIDVEEVPEPHLSDAEISYFLEEWGGDVAT